MTNMAMTHAGVEITAAYFPGVAVDPGRWYSFLSHPIPSFQDRDEVEDAKATEPKQLCLSTSSPPHSHASPPHLQPPGTLLQCRGSVTPTSAVPHSSNNRGLPLPFNLPPAPPASGTIRLLVSELALPSITDCLTTLSFTSPDSGQERQLGQSSYSAESQTCSHLGSARLCCGPGALLIQTLLRPTRFAKCPCITGTTWDAWGWKMRQMGWSEYHRAGPRAAKSILVAMSWPAAPGLQYGL